MRDKYVSVDMKLINVDMQVIYVNMQNKNARI